jgi:hypothetical protein
MAVCLWAMVLPFTGWTHDSVRTLRDMNYLDSMGAMKRQLHAYSIADMLLASRCLYAVLAERIIGKQVRAAQATRSRRKSCTAPAAVGGRGRVLHATVINHGKATRQSQRVRRPAWIMRGTAGGGGPGRASTRSSSSPSVSPCDTVAHAAGMCNRGSSLD